MVRCGIEIDKHDSQTRATPTLQVSASQAILFREIFLIGGTYPNENIYLHQYFLNNSFARNDAELGSAVFNASLMGMMGDAVFA